MPRRRRRRTTGLDAAPPPRDAATGRRRALADGDGERTGKRRGATPAVVDEATPAAHERMRRRRAAHSPCRPPCGLRGARRRTPGDRSLAQRLPDGAEGGRSTGLKLALVSARRGERGSPSDPGPLEARHERRRARVGPCTFSTREAPLAAATADVALHAASCRSTTGDVELSLEGGPVPLSLLGRAGRGAGRVAARRRPARAASSSTARAARLTFDGAARGPRLSPSRDPRLAADVVRGPRLRRARARGVLSDRASSGSTTSRPPSARSTSRRTAVLEQTPDHVAAAFDFDVPMTAARRSSTASRPRSCRRCAARHVSGTFGAAGRLAFDTRKLDDLALDYDDRGPLPRSSESPPSSIATASPSPSPIASTLPTASSPRRRPGRRPTTGPTSTHISPFMQVAVLTTEDGGFFHHHGFNHAAIRNALLANLKARRFVRGASTITMQLAKNLFLSREKTLSRKLEEVILTDYLEQAFTKDEMIELYLNVIEFGPDVYGITAAADHYFGRARRAQPRRVPVPVVDPARARSLPPPLRARRAPRRVDQGPPRADGDRAAHRQDHRRRARRGAERARRLLTGRTRARPRVAPASSAPHCRRRTTARRWQRAPEGRDHFFPSARSAAKNADSRVGALVREHAAHDLEAVIEPRVAADREERPHRARLRIVAAVDDPRDARVNERPRAHRARLERHVQRRALEPPGTAAAPPPRAAPPSRRAPSGRRASRAGCGRARARARRRRRDAADGHLAVGARQRRPPPSAHAHPLRRRLAHRRPTVARGPCGNSARPGRFELPTPGSVDQCSIQLSYGRKHSRGRTILGAPTLSTTTHLRSTFR